MSTTWNAFRAMIAPFGEPLMDYQKDHGLDGPSPDDTHAS